MPPVSSRYLNIAKRENSMRRARTPNSDRMANRESSRPVPSCSGWSVRAPTGRSAAGPHDAPPSVEPRLCPRWHSNGAPLAKAAPRGASRTVPGPEQRSHATAGGLDDQLVAAPLDGREESPSPTAGQSKCLATRRRGSRQVGKLRQSHTASSLPDSDPRGLGARVHLTAGSAADGDRQTSTSWRPRRSRPRRAKARE